MGRLVLIGRQSACHVQRHIVQHIYCTNTAQDAEYAKEM